MITKTIYYIINDKKPPKNWWFYFLSLILSKLKNKYYDTKTKNEEQLKNYVESSLQSIKEQYRKLLEDYQSTTPKFKITGYQRWI